ncbi:MAG: imidazole glycerol phosphate synthase cyclase subunit [Proteobacteria bacterium]|nr:imidazole glycerol phosphate synthase cyclase subunit [Pseudomonadota bacterium]MBU4296699.1 imidazole glycerol phosphate synthase cyclase subunit [Pseudomonadota bacterium]MCG2748492.1 imidazole glycerol phosphate synthase cyclase subunit [Desulfobulbaceae bacterium]
MLKVRIIPTLLYKNFGLVKGISFDSWRRVGSALQTIMVYSMREVDELIFLDITATGEQRDPDFEVVDDLADDCFMPLTVGGGIQTIDHVRQLLMMGADKVAINTGAVLNPQLIKDIANRFGSQCAVVSIDYKTHANGVHEIFTHSGTRATGLSPVTFAQQAEEMGAGEILLTSIDRDGTMQGYEPDCLRQVSKSVSIPVIASGGAGNAEDMYLAIHQGKASAVAAASIFHFTEQTPLEMKHYLRGKNIPVRL